MLKKKLITPLRVLSLGLTAWCFTVTSVSSVLAKCNCSCYDRKNERTFLKGQVDNIDQCIRICQTSNLDYRACD